MHATSAYTAAAQWIRISTKGLIPQEQFQVWRDLACDEYDSHTQMPPEQGYELEYVGFSCGPLSLAHCKRGAAAGVRNKGHIRASVDHWLCTQVLLRGYGEGRMGAVDYRSTPRGVLVMDMSRPAEVWRRGGEVISFRISRDQLSVVAPYTGDLQGFYPGGFAAELFKDHLQSVMRRASDISPESAVPIFEATGRLLAAALMPTGEAVEAAKPELDEAMLKRAKAYVEKNLLAPELTPESIARGVGLSRRKLYLLFEPEGGVQRYVQLERLERARSALSEGGPGYKVKTAAFDHGFTSEAHFSRSFKRRFGYNASEAGEALRAFG